MAEWPHKLTGLERFLGSFTRLRPGEGSSVLVFFTYALLMMLSYYILKTIREPLLLFIVPVYGLVFRHTGKQQMTRYITGFFLANLLILYLAGKAGLDIGFACYVRVGMNCSENSVTRGRRCLNCLNRHRGLHEEHRKVPASICENFMKSWILLNDARKRSWAPVE